MWISVGEFQFCRRLFCLMDAHSSRRI